MERKIFPQQIPKDKKQISLKTKVAELICPANLSFIIKGITTPFRPCDITCLVPSEILPYSICIQSENPSGFLIAVPFTKGVQAFPSLLY